MSEELLEKLEPFFPAEFFRLGGEVNYVKNFSSRKLFAKKPTLFNTSDLLAEDHFADVVLSWNDEGLLCETLVKKPFDKASYPNYREGDSFELFIDTRDYKESGFATKFCHHFVFLPKPTDGIQCQEVTHFRSEDRHPLCDSDELTLNAEFTKSAYEMRITIPVSCLHGFDPSSFGRLGFTYRVNRASGKPQHFSVSSSYYDIAQTPSLWASLKLAR